MMENIILIDTNLYLDDANIIFKLSNECSKILIPITVLKELDKKKYEIDLGYSARSAIRSILQFLQDNPDTVIFDAEYDRTLENDAQIIESAKRFGAAIATKDVSMSIIAKSKGLRVSLQEMILNNIFNPYIHIDMDFLHQETEDTGVFSYDNCYEEEDYFRLLTVFSKIAGYEVDCDTWFFVLVDTGKTCPVIYANNPLTSKLFRIDNNPNYRQIRIPDGSTELKARDCYQVCALYALEEAPHSLITGRWGSGKTLISTAHALSKSKDKTFITRAPLGINPKYNLGFMPGDKDEKMMDWLQGFMSALYYLYGNTSKSIDSNGNSYDYVKEKYFDQKFEILAMNSIQGLSLLDEDTLIVDEAQLITIDYMSMILSRPSETGKLILLGDIKQTYSVVKPSESGLLKLLRILPSKYIAYVELQNSYRSPLLEVADMLQDRSII
jgi:PhoH-like ATPase